ncbi:hypothetical protein E0G74_01315 [Salmonella enterica]|nr:hypothetical protein [Salmonella enterica]
MSAKTLPPDVYAFINRYRELIGAKPTEEQALLLKYFIQAGEALPVDDNRDWFYCAWRKVDVIESNVFMCSKDMIVWNLIKLDTVIDQVVNELLPVESKHAF